MHIRKRYWLLVALLALCCVASLYVFEQNPYKTAADTYRGRVLGFELFRIPSDSMMPTLIPGDYIFVSTQAYQDSSPKLNDVITFLYPKDRTVNYVKRLIGVPGDRIKVESFQVYVNDIAIQQDYLDKSLVKKPFSRYMQQLVVPPDHLFVMGDNRDNSNDSRFFGMIKKSDLIGKATHILYGKEQRSWQSIE